MQLLLSNQEIEEILIDVVNNFLIPRFLQLGLRASGEWERSLSVSGSELWGAEYTEQLVWGRRPGQMPPIAPIERWAQVKLGLSGTAARSAAFAIAKKIAKEGTEIYKEGGTDLMEILESKETIDYINEKYKLKLEKIIETDLVRHVKEAFK